VWEDHCKLGFSRDPLSRLQALHRRWFELFDLDRGLLVETDTVREARDLELELGRPLVDHNAPAPLTVRREAAGHTEWYRGASALLEQAGDMLLRRGHVVHAPLRAWLQPELRRRSSRPMNWTGGPGPRRRNAWCATHWMPAMRWRSTWNRCCRRGCCAGIAAIRSGCHGPVHDYPCNPISTHSPDGSCTLIPVGWPVCRYNARAMQSAATIALDWSRYHASTDTSSASRQPCCAGVTEKSERSMTLILRMKTARVPWPD
jgi:hypothetical protein